MPMQTRKVTVVLGTVLLVSLGSWGCATKKHVREAIAPVQDQVNTVQKQSAENKTAIGDLDRQVATADEKAGDAGKRAGQAMDAANQAKGAAQTAQQRADAANALAQQGIDATAKVDSKFNNLDNYHLVNTQQVFFKTARYNLDKEAQADLDNALQNIANMKDYVIEIEGYADHTGAKSFNEELSRKRADAVVRYLTVDHNIPLRDVRILGVGSDFPNAVNKTRDDRKNNRRVDIKIYALDINGTGGPSQAATNPGGSNNGQADRMNQDQMPAADSTTDPTSDPAATVT